MTSNEAKLKKLKFARLRFVSDLKHAISAAGDLTQAAKKLLIVSKDCTLDRCFEEFTKNTNDIMAMTDAMEDHEAFFQLNQSLEDLYHTTKAHLDEILPDDEDLSISRSYIGAERPVQNNNPIQNVKTRSHLPDMKIGSFEGNYEDWDRFSQMFTKLVAKEKLDPIEKLYYLINALKGEPLQMVKHLPVTDESFDRAWEVLKKTYEVRRHIVNAQFELFFGIKKMQTENAAELRNMLRICIECEGAFNALNIDAHTIGLMMVFYCAKQMDTETMRQWESELKNQAEEAKLSELIEFLQMRCRMVSNVEKSMQSSSAPTNENRSNRLAKTFFSQNNKESGDACNVCDSNHKTFNCPMLTNATVEERQKIITDKRLCYNCFFKHRVSDCRSRNCCFKCHKRHNTLLHFDKNENAAPNGIQNTNFSGHLKEGRQTLLATACVPVYNVNGEKTLVRALIDQGSTANFVSEKICQLISSKRHRIDTVITSLNDSQTGKIKSYVNLTIGSLYDSEYRYNFDALVLPKITNVEPLTQVQTSEWKHIANLELADPKCMEHGDIDLLIGARVYAEIILSGLKKGGPNAPIAQLTKIGWIISGACEPNKLQVSCHLSIAEENSLSKDLQRFWELEEVENRKMITNEDEKCEQRFAESWTRAEDGKLKTRLPFKIDPSANDVLGNSHNQAYVRLMQLERRLSRDEKLYEMYRQVINEYLDLGHMREATPEEMSDPKGYFLPHHAVIKMNKSTSKVRVVFDASCKSSNGKSLNDLLMVGPTIQDDLFTLVLRWRKYKIAYTGDIEKMYRQFWVHEEDAKYQRILWRNHPTDPVKQYVLLTVTFGTASAPFQAIRCIHQIANEIELSKPEIAKAIKEQFYVDDFLSSGDTVEFAIQEQTEVKNALKEYGLNLTKWKSNSREFQERIPESEQDKVLELSDTSCKALGILWQPQTDVFTFKLSLEEIKLPLTKRKIVSETAKLFDPLGWLAPSIVLAKLIIQQLWMEALNWDDKLPIELQQYWLKMRALLFECDQIKIDRWVGLTKTTVSHSIHGFSDASERAYAAVVYLRTVQTDGSIRINLLAAKSKVAPLQKVTLPRLELCGALLLAKLINKIVKAMNFVDVPVHAYSDSTIVIGWLNEMPIKWKTFVANRVAEIQALVPANDWRHVMSQMNPADCASRGMFIDELRTHKLWWNGPDFLKLAPEMWPIRGVTKTSNIELPERRKAVKLFHAKIAEQNDLLSRCSTLSQLLHLTAYTLRWRKFKRETSVNGAAPLLTVEELENALKWWIRIAQSDEYPHEIHRLKKGKEIRPSSSIIKLMPQIDGDLLMRVGGRLNNLDLSKDTINPIILPPKHHFTWLIIEDAHQRVLHGGCQVTEQFIRQRFWILHSRDTISKQINKCVRCIRYRKLAQKQLMGDLPKFRAQPALPFQFTGVDFAGYFEVKMSTQRNAPYEKCYVSIFVCMVTKAVHLELVKDLSTEAFLDAFRCFAARRGIPTKMYSDRGSNFIGACTEMPNLLYDAQQTQTQLIVNELLNSKVEWNFNPAHAAHFGGLWESKVKSMKFHLHRVLHQAKLTEHKFRTVITQIEGVLNSRPLCRLTEDPEDLEVLTPGHFLIGRAINTLPEPSYLDIPQNRLSVYQYIQRLTQDFWKRWHKEYLYTLQARSKWTKRENNVAVGQIVILIEENLPPSRWLLGRITKVSYGPDQLVRVVEVKCKNAILTRSIHKLCLLPTADNDKLLFEQLQSLKGGSMLERPQLT